MSEQRPRKDTLTIYLSADVAGRLKVAAEAQKRPAVDLVADLLDRHLPRPRLRPQEQHPVLLSRHLQQRRMSPGSQGWHQCRRRHGTT